MLIHVDSWLWPQFSEHLWGVVMVHHVPHADRNPSRLEKLLAHPGEAWRMAWPGMEYIDTR
jgi:hypothetical protein